MTVVLIIIHRTSIVFIRQGKRKTTKYLPIYLQTAYLQSIFLKYLCKNSDIEKCCTYERRP